MRAPPRVCRVCGKKRNYPRFNDSGCSRGSSSCEPIQQTGYKLVERIDFVGKNATTVACDHPRSRRKSIRRRFERSRGVRRNTKSIRYKRGCSLRIIHDKESIYVNTARGRSLRMFMKEITVAEPLELFRLKCTIDRRTTAISLTHFKRNNPLVCRVSARFNHDSAGSK
jgi:hypothetical protein